MVGWLGNCAEEGAVSAYGTCSCLLSLRLLLPSCQQCISHHRTFLSGHVDYLGVVHLGSTYSTQYYHPPIVKEQRLGSALDTAD